MIKNDQITKISVNCKFWKEVMGCKTRGGGGVIRVGRTVKYEEVRKETWTWQHGGTGSLDKDIVSGIQKLGEGTRCS